MSSRRFEGSDFVRACRGQPHGCVPVWFMRQAGRSLPEYRAVRGDGSILDAIADPDRAADRLLDRGVSLAVVKMGADGVLVATPEGRSSVQPVPVEVVCGLGAGDAFGGALADGLLAGLDPVEMVTRANAAGAIVAGRLTCADAMPTTAEIDAVLAGGDPSEAEAA